MTSPGLSAEVLAEIRERAENATEGPWEAGDVWVFTDPVYPDDKRLSDVLGMKFEDEDRAKAERTRGLVNADFIAHAREDIPDLLREIDRLRPQEVATVAELDALPTATVILDRVGQAHQRAMDGSWYLAAGDEGGHDADEYRKVFPVTVLWRGSES